MEMQSMTKEFQTKVTLWIVVEDLPCLMLIPVPCFLGWHPFKNYKSMGVQPLSFYTGIKANPVAYSEKLYQE